MGKGAAELITRTMENVVQAEYQPIIIAKEKEGVEIRKGFKTASVLTWESSSSRPQYGKVLLKKGDLYR